MKHHGIKNPNADLNALGLTDVTTFWNTPVATLVEHALAQDQGVLSDTGALCIDTGEFTGRSPKDRFIVKDDITTETVDWGEINKPFDADKFDTLHKKVINYLNGKKLYVRDAFACADPKHRLPVRFIMEQPWQSIFINNMFLRPSSEELEQAVPEWTVIAAPSFMAEADEDGTRQHNFAIINFTKKIILIGGTGYTGEMKKGIFSVLNFILPTEKGILSMHCSSNVGKEEKDTAVFFGLSGTGKTTLSADPNRLLIGDDEHGWSEDSVFNFEGGCYAKCIDLSAEKEPEIFKAIKFGALLENINFQENTRSVDYTNIDKTPNTRVSYPIHHIDDVAPGCMGDTPKNIFFLTCDCFGILPPISRLSVEQAMYHFISGYTAKVAGTEEGINEPQVVFSACFGAPFLPLHPTKYAEMLGKKLRKHKTNVWLVNTGWSGGPYGEGKRMKLKFTRAMITAALNGDLDQVAYQADDIFGLEMPATCPNVPTEVLNPRNTWAKKEDYDQLANQLARYFNDNFEKYASQASEEILAAAPKVVVNK